MVVHNLFSIFRSKIHNIHINVVYCEAYTMQYVLCGMWGEKPMIERKQEQELEQKAYCFVVEAA